LGRRDGRAAGDARGPHQHRLLLRVLERRRARRAASADKTAKLWDAETGALQSTLEGHIGNVMCCAFSPYGERVVTASSDKTARLWSVAL
jgi:WD40 repeat protein